MIAMKDECHLTFSPLCQKVAVNGKAFAVLIYSDLEGEWFLEVADGPGNAIICEDLFASDELALEFSDKMIKAIASLG